MKLEENGLSHLKAPELRKIYDVEILFQLNIFQRKASCNKVRSKREVFAF